MWYRRIALLAGLALLVLLVGASPVAASQDDIRVKGFAGVPGTSLVLPLTGGPVMIDVSFGIDPTVTLPIQVTQDTKIKTKGKGKNKGSIVVTDGDAVKIRAALVGSVLRATRLELEDFPELELTGTVQDLPPGGVGLPLPGGTTEDLTLAVSPTVELPMVLTPKTKISGPSHLTLRNGDVVRVEAVVRGGFIVITKLKPGEEEDDDEDDDD